MMVWVVRDSSDSVTVERNLKQVSGVNGTSKSLEVALRFQNSFKWAAEIVLNGLEMVNKCTHSAAFKKNGHFRNGQNGPLDRNSHSKMVTFQMFKRASNGNSNRPYIHLVLIHEF